MATLERHDPWIDWKFNTIGAMRNVSSGALVSHEFTSAKTEALLRTFVQKKSLWLKVERYAPLNDTHSNTESLDADSSVGLKPWFKTKASKSMRS